jgi:hypothetical protein
MPVKVLEIICICLPAMEGTCIAGSGGQVVGLRKAPFASLQVFQSLAIDIGSEVSELAETIVRVPVEEPYERPVPQLHNTLFQGGTKECAAELAAYIVSNS